MNQGRSPDPYYAQFYTRLAPQPGLIPLRPLNLGDILDGSFKVIRRNPRATLGLSAIVAVVQGIVLAFAQVIAYGPLSHAIDNTDPNNPQFHLGSLLSGEGMAILGGLIGALFAAVLAGMLTLVVTEDVLGNRLSIAQVWQRIRPKLVRLIALSLVVSIVPTVALIGCFVPGIWLWGLWTVAVPAMIVENAGVGRSLGRSRALVSGTFWRVFGIRALGFLIVSVCGALVTIPFGLLAAAITGRSLVPTAESLSVPLSYILISAVGTIIATTLTAPVRAALDALIYVDLRMRKEGMDLVLQQAAAGLAAPGGNDPGGYRPPGGPAGNRS
jgi:hypothetical protein